MTSRAILDSADDMRTRCAVGVPANDNPGAWLGSAIASLAQSGRDKLTLLTSPTLDSFGLWAEQLIAESLGKDGRGIVPVTAEPLGEVGLYTDDRQFAYLKLRGEDSEADALVTELARAGHPVSPIRDRRRERAGRRVLPLGVRGGGSGGAHRGSPIQPAGRGEGEGADAAGAGVFGVERRRFLDAFRGFAVRASVRYAGGGLPGDSGIRSSRRRRTTRRCRRLRSAILREYGIPTTLGYGPRYLHSTGQLHKGGPDSVAALVVVSPHEEDIPRFRARNSRLARSRTRRQRRTCKRLGTRGGGRRVLGWMKSLCRDKLSEQLTGILTKPVRGAIYLSRWKMTLSQQEVLTLDSRENFGAVGRIAEYARRMA